MSKASSFEKEDLKDEILKQITSSKYSLTPAQLYNISSIKNLCQPNEVRLQVREIKRRCNQLVKDGKLIDTEAASDKQGEASGPYSINPNAAPVPKPMKPKPTPIPAPKTVIKPKTSISIPDELTPDFTKIILKVYRSEYGTTSSPDSIGEIFEVASGLLMNNTKITTITNIIISNIKPSDDPDASGKIFNCIIELMGGYFTFDKIINSMERLDNVTYSEERAIIILSKSDSEELNGYATKVLVDNNFPTYMVNISAVRSRFKKITEGELKSEPSPVLKHLTSEDITEQEVMQACHRVGLDFDKAAKDKIIPPELVNAITILKKSQGFDILDDKIIMDNIKRVYKEYSDKLATVPIDERIIIPSNPSKDTIYEARIIDPLLDSLTTHALDSKDYEIIPIALRLQKDGKLPLALWQRILAHKQNGTMMELNKENIPIYQKLKFIINRIDSVTNRDDKEFLIKTLFEFPQYNLKPLSPQLISLIETYFDNLSQAPVSASNKDDIAKKLALLDTITLSDSDKRIVSNIRSVVDADAVQRANELVINNLIHQNVKKFTSSTKETIDFGKSDYSDISFITPLSSEEKILNSIASRITISSAPKVAVMVQQILTLREDLIEELYSDMLHGEDTEINEGLIYFYHKDLIPPLIYDTIRNILMRK